MGGSLVLSVGTVTGRGKGASGDEHWVLYLSTLSSNTRNAAQEQVVSHTVCFLHYFADVAGRRQQLFFWLLVDITACAVSFVFFSLMVFDTVSCGAAGATCLFPT